MVFDGSPAGRLSGSCSTTLTRLLINPATPLTTTNHNPTRVSFADGLTPSFLRITSRLTVSTTSLLAQSLMCPFRYDAIPAEHIRSCGFAAPWANTFL